MERFSSSASGGAATAGEAHPFQWTGSDDEPPAWIGGLAEAQQDELSLIMATYPEALIFPSKKGEASIRLKLEGANIHAHLLIVLPRKYPDDSAERPAVQLSSTNLLPEVLSDIQQTLKDNLETLHEAGCLNVLSVFNQANDIIASMPLALQSDSFACCVDCNTRRLRAGLAKIPQPIRFIDDHDQPAAECIACRGSNVVLVPSMRLNIQQLCSMCFCEDNPLIHLECGCRSCFPCFQRFADISTGQKIVRRHTRTKLYGIPCPNHESTVIVDYGLLKLCEPRVFFRFNHFSVIDACTKRLQGYCCPVPGCSGLPMFTDILGGVVRCAYCQKWSCVRCEQAVLGCECEQLKRDETVNWITLRMAFDNNQIFLDRPVVSHTARSARILCVLGDERIEADVFYDDTKWEARLTKDLRREDVNPRWFVNEYHPEERGRCVFYVFHGQPLNPTRTLRHVGIFTGAIIFALVYEPQRDRRRTSELELWTFRRAVSGQEGRKTPEGMKSAVQNAYKRCPFCSKPVAHYHQHGCHHMGGYAGACCGKGWCYVCLSEWPCTKCPLFCTPKCGCPPCPECKPMLPCAQCSGCSLCQPGQMANFA